MPQVALDGFKLSSVSIEQYVSHIDQLLAQKAFVLGSGCVSKSILDSYGMLQSYTHTASYTTTCSNGHILNIFVTTIDNTASLQNDGQKVPICKVELNFVTAISPK